MEISRHSHYDHDIVGLQKTGRQADLNNVKVWRPGLWRPLDQGRGDARNLHSSKTRARHQIDIYFTGDYADLSSIKEQAQNIHYPRYNGSWIKGIRKLGANNLIFIPEGEEKDIKCKVSFVTGTATVVITCKGKYKASIEKTFEIMPLTITDIRRYSGYTYDGVNIFNLKATAEPYVVYDGKVHKVKPSVTLLRNGKKTAFKEGRDYTLVYDEEKYDYMSPGSHTFSVVGKGNFEGKFNLSFNIQKKKLISKATVKKLPTKDYTGDEVSLTKEELVVSYKGKKLTEDVDYYTYYSGNVDAGTATVTIRGMGDYFGSKTATFRIKGKPLSKCVFEGLDEEVYYSENGATPPYSKIKIYTDKTRTEEVEDYYIQFTDNKKPGKGTIIFIGKNGYEGTVKKTYKILGVPIDSVLIR